MRVWVPAPDHASPFEGTDALHGLIQHVGGGPAVSFHGAGHLLSLVHGALAGRSQQAPPRQEQDNPGASQGDGE